MIFFSDITVWVLKTFTLLLLYYYHLTKYYGNSFDMSGLKVHKSISECRLNENNYIKLVKCENGPLLIVYGSYKSQMIHFYPGNGELHWKYFTFSVAREHFVKGIPKWPLTLQGLLFYFVMCVSKVFQASILSLSYSKKKKKKGFHCSISASCWWDERPNRVMRDCCPFPCPLLIGLLFCRCVWVEYQTVWLMDWKWWTSRESPRVWK